MPSSKDEKVYLPEAVTFDTLNRILQAYLRAGAYEKPVSYKDASTRSGVHPTVVSSNNKFLVSTGFLNEESRGTFKLSEKATRYVQLLDWEKTEEAKEPLRELLPESSFVEQILDFVKINKKVTKDELMTKIISISGLPKKRRYMTGVNALFEMLTFSGLLKEEDDAYSSGAPTLTPEKTEVSTKSIKLPSSATIVTAEKEVIPISISINIDENISIEKLKDVIRALKEVLQE
jgi:hypothetical protein